MIEISDRVKDDGTVGEPANEIVLFLVEKHAPQGLTLLNQDPHVDEDRVRRAKLIAKDAWKQKCEADIISWREYMDGWKKLPANQGKPLPAPPQYVSDAQMYLDELTAETAEEFKYICPIAACIKTNDFGVYQRHMKVAHSQDVSEEPVAPEVPEVKEEASGAPAEAPVKKRRGRPPKNKAQAPQAPPAT
jgi:hypothetical protein